MAWIYLTPLEGGAANQMQGVCETNNDLDSAATEGVIDALGRRVRLGIGSAALCLESGNVSFLGSGGNWTEVKT